MICVNEEETSTTDQYFRQQFEEIKDGPPSPNASLDAFYVPPQNLGKANIQVEGRHYYRSPSPYSIKFHKKMFIRGKLYKFGDVIQDVCGLSREKFKYTLNAAMQTQLEKGLKDDQKQEFDTRMEGAQRYARKTMKAIHARNQEQLVQDTRSQERATPR